MSKFDLNKKNSLDKFFFFKYQINIQLFEK